MSTCHEIRFVLFKDKSESYVDRRSAPSRNPIETLPLLIPLTLGGPPLLLGVDLGWVEM